MNEIRVKFSIFGKDYIIYLSKKLPFKPSKGDIINMKYFIDKEDKKNIPPEEYNKFYNDSINRNLEFVCKEVYLSKDQYGFFIEAFVSVKGLID